MKRLAVFASGRGSNFKAMIDHVKMEVLRDVEIAMLISNVPDAPALELARQNSIPVATIEGVYGRKFPSKQARQEARDEFDRNALDTLTREKVELVALAGFMQVLGPQLVNAYRYRIMNIHPAKDLAKFGGSGMFGDRVHAAVIQAGELESGCTVHYVDNTIDGGPVILQATVPVEAGDTPDTLAHRILIQEHRTYSKAIQLHVDGRLLVKEGKVQIDRSEDWENDWARRQQAFIESQTVHSHGHEQLLSSQA